MQIKYTIRIKLKHNPPTFNEDFGQGVVATQIVDFKGATEKDLEKPNFQRQIIELAEKLKNEFFEVKIEIQK